MKRITIVLGTKNRHKVKEIMAIWRLSKSPRPNIRFIPLTKLSNIPEIKETGQTYLANATKKAITWAKYTGLPVLSEDSGLEVKALKWQPGIYSARYASIPLRREGKGRILLDPFGNKKNATYKDNNQKLLAKLQGLPISKRTARYRCSAVIASPKGRIIARSQGTCWGRIAFKTVGRNGFGYDPIFIPNSVYTERSECAFPIPHSAFGLTFGQLPARLKHRISHRGIALRKIFSKLPKIIDIS